MLYIFRMYVGTCRYICYILSHLRLTHLLHPSECLIALYSLLQAYSIHYLASLFLYTFVYDCVRNRAADPTYSASRIDLGIIFWPDFGTAKSIGYWLEILDIHWICWIFIGYVAYIKYIVHTGNIPPVN